ncbi:unnamed protein product [Arabis nemorensis]|uniref:Protein TILLER ANGLE CONTROL 1 n=1 Tax=Arabis nemorensis TaxID=586526 RepID=A0A565BQ05_9BRAS|nr:unnamed protein product [Arabis nemorensis]
MLDQVGLVDALDNWFDGVLTIGTFGFDSLKFQEEEDEIDDDECESVDLDYVVIDGSIVKNINQELDPLISNENNFHDHHDDLKVLNADQFNLNKTTERAVVAVAVQAEIEPQKKRTTLAELFMEDEDEGDNTWHDKKPKNPKLDHDDHEVKQNRSKLSTKFLFAKKKMIMSKSKDKEKDSRPIKKVQQMIKRMLKKKIHPDIDATKAFKNDVVPYKKCEALESRYLLNINQECVGNLVSSRLLRDVFAFIFQNHY